MSNEKKMQSNVSTLISKVSKWCLKNSNENFSCFFSYHTHVGSFDVQVFPNGWDSHDNPIEFSFYLTGSLHNYEELHEQVFDCLSELRELLKKSKKNNAT